MAWLSHNEQFYSDLPPAELLNRVRASLLPAGEPTWRDDYQSAAAHCFQGSVMGNTFEVLRYAHRVRTGRPVGPFPIRGEVWANATGSYVKLRISLGQETELSIRVALGLAVVILLATGITGLFRSHAFFLFQNLAVLLGGLAVFWLAITSFNLRQEVITARPLLVRLLHLYPPL